MSPCPFKCVCGASIPHTNKCLTANGIQPAVDPIRYGYGDLPKVGATVTSPSGRTYLVINVVGAHKVVCQRINSAETATFQANDLRKAGQPVPRATVEFLTEQEMRERYGHVSKEQQDGMIYNWPYNGGRQK